MHHLIRIALVAAVLTVNSSAQEERGRAAASAYEQGKKHFEAKQYAKAYEKFLEAFRENPGDLNTNFMLGRAAFEMGNYQTAVMAFERILMVRPDLQRVKLELARSYFRLNSYEIAKRYFGEVLATDLPPEVRRNIEGLMEQMRPGFFSGTLSMGYNWDSNVRLSPENSRIGTAIGERVLAPEDRLKRDEFISTTLVVDHKYRLAEGRRLWWKTTALNYNAYYNHEDELDVNYFSVLTGPAIESEEWALELRGLGTYVEEGRHAYLRSVGGTSFAVRALNEHVLLAMGAKAEYLSFYDERDRSGLNLSASIGPVLVWGENRVVTQFGFEEQGARDGTEAYDGFRALVRYERQLPLDIRLILGYRFEDSHYDATEPDFATRRRDRFHAFSVGLSKQITSNLWAELSHTYTDCSSSVELYDYDRHLTAIALSLRF